ncbi:response regulator [Cohnella cholangitidis]|uniref:Response regulator n=1 Tax=Cohnella cholangitidis TaxID=2598458 RepID=A0A7G5C387_9BACL|nr:response regulator [Cohnella cholangitidis]QMV43671.1 response regulator [Cohnella cholangitidis]
MFRLLIVDDEFHIREGLKHLVPQTGLPIEIAALAEDGETALRLFEEQKPDMAIMDINLPDMSGLEVARQLRDKGDEVPLLFLTGYESLAYIREAIGLQAVDYLLKPITSDELAKGLLRAQESVKRQRKVAEGMEHKQIKQRSIAQEYALLDLLLQRRSVEDTIGEIRSWQMPAPNGDAPYVVLCCDLDVIPPRVNGSDEQRLYGYAFSKLAIEAASSVSGTLGAAMAPDRVIIVLPNAYGRTVEEVVGQVRSVLRKYMDVTMTVGISSAVRQLNRLPDAYREAVHAAEHKGWVGNGQVIPYESVQIVQTQHDHLDKEFILISEIRAGNDGAVLAILREWSARLEQLPSRQARMLATQLVLFVMRVVKSHIPHAEDGTPLDPLLTLSQLSNGHDIIRFVTEYFVQVGRLIRENREATVPRMFEQAKNWIREHLKEDVSLNGLAMHLHLSPKYLSSRFKQVTGECFADYLTRVRFERARELLLDSERKVGEVAESVGFGDANYFSIAFKKNTGFTPTEFRKRYL